MTKLTRENASSVWTQKLADASSALYTAQTALCEARDAAQLLGHKRAADILDKVAAQAWQLMHELEQAKGY